MATQEPPKAILSLVRSARHPTDSRPTSKSRRALITALVTSAAPVVLGRTFVIPADAFLQRACRILVDKREVAAVTQTSPHISPSRLSSNLMSFTFDGLPTILRRHAGHRLRWPRPCWSFARLRARAPSTIATAMLSVARVRRRAKSCAIIAALGEICGLGWHSPGKRGRGGLGCAGRPTCDRSRSAWCRRFPRSHVPACLANSAIRWRRLKSAIWCLRASQAN